MVGFSFKNVLLQIIHGGLLLITLLFVFYFDSIGSMLDYFKGSETGMAVLLVCASFSIGVIIDFFADSIEAFILKQGWILPPYYYLLGKKDHSWGICLAHSQQIKADLLLLAATYNQDKTVKDYEEVFDSSKPDAETLNYVFQVAKNKAFREGEEYQKDQIESFFMLYIFSRNLTLSLIASILLLYIPNYSCYQLLLLFLLPVVSLLSAYRYNLYYSRIVLGTTFKED